MRRDFLFVLLAILTVASFAPAQTLDQLPPPPGTLQPPLETRIDLDDSAGDPEIIAIQQRLALLELQVATMRKVSVVTPIAPVVQTVPMAAWGVQVQAAPMMAGRYSSSYSMVTRESFGVGARAGACAAKAGRAGLFSRLRAGGCQ